MTYAALVALLQRAIPATAPFVGSEEFLSLIRKHTGLPLCSTRAVWAGLVRRGYVRLAPSSAGVYRLTEDTVIDSGLLPGTGTPVVEMRADA